MAEQPIRQELRLHAENKALLASLPDEAFMIVRWGLLQLDMAPCMRWQPSSLPGRCQSSELDRYAS